MIRNNRLISKKMYILVISIFSFSFSIYGQYINLNGTLINNSKTPISFAKILLMNNKTIMGGAISDFDGNFSINNVLLPLDSIHIEIKPFDCFEGKKITKIILINDSTITPIILNSYNCDSIIETQCKYLHPSCDVYEVIPLYDCPRSRWKYTKVQYPDKKIICLLPEYYLKECCLKKWYCVTHQYRY